MRTGIGYDVHPLARGRKLVLGGVVIPFKRGLGGHSDADVLTHAIIDALLGAAHLEDIGRNFPDTDPAYKDAVSLDLLRTAHSRVIAGGFSFHYLDAVVIAEAPKLMGFIPEMEKKLADALGTDPKNVSVKAKTNERLGFEGKKKGIAAWAIVALREGVDER